MKISASRSGKVFIVGAGVGGVEYLTVRAHQLLSRAEVVVYDALADEMLLDIVPMSCDRLYVGKRGGRDSMPQAEINFLLVEQCQQGKPVVRLKSGDPWIFGHSVSEIKALREAGCEYELVPGISSAIAAPLFAGIPLTDPELSPCFAVLTAHDLKILPWTALASIPTLAILMGTANLSELIPKLREGRPSDTPIAIVQWGGRPQQQVWTGTLADIQARLPERSLSPAVIIVGDVVKYREGMRWYESFLTKDKPLQGKTILVTRAVGQSSQFTELLTAQGAKVVEMPALAILPPSSWSDLDRAIAQLDTYDWLILTSANAVDSFFARLHHWHKDSRALHNLKVAVVGRKTADVLATHGIKPDFVPPDFVADSLIENFPPVDGLKILFPRVQSGGREILIEQFGRQGAVVDAIAAYESGCPAQIDPVALQALQNRQVDVVTFASSKTVKHFYQLLSQAVDASIWQPWLASANIASIGPQTSATCRELLGRMDIEAEEYTLEGLTQAIASSYMRSQL